MVVCLHLATCWVPGQADWSAILSVQCKSIRRMNLCSSGNGVCVCSVKYNSLFIMRANICMFLLHFSYLLPWQLCTVPLQSDYVLTNPSYEYEYNLFLLSYCVQMSWKNHFFIENVYLCIWQTLPKLLTVHLMYILSVFVFPVRGKQITTYDILAACSKRSGDNNM